MPYVATPGGGQVWVSEPTSPGVNTTKTGGTLVGVTQTKPSWVGGGNTNATPATSNNAVDSAINGIIEKQTSPYPAAITYYGATYPTTVVDGKWGFYMVNTGGSKRFIPMGVAPKSGGGGGGGGGGGAGSPGAINSVADIYRLWMGDAWVASHASVISSAVKNGWTERMIIKDAVSKGANTPYATAMANYIKGVVGPLTTEAINNILGSGIWMEPNFETQIAPQYMTDVLSNPQSLPFLQSWNEYTAGATLGVDAQAKMKEIVTTFGFTNAAQAQWENWLTTTTAAVNGNYGADKRAVINHYIQTWFGRDATEAELSPPSNTTTTTTTPGTSPRVAISAGTKDAASVMAAKKLLNAAGWQPPLTIDDPNYGPKMTAAVKWYQGQNGLTVSGTLDTATWTKMEPPAPTTTSTTGVDAATGQYWTSIGGLMGDYQTSAFLEKLRGSDEYLTNFAAKMPDQTEEDFLAWKDSVNSIGNWYFNDRPGTFDTQYTNGFEGFTNEELAKLNQEGWNANTLGQYYQNVEEAAYNQGVYAPILEEAFGTSFTDDEWFSLANGGEGSGELRSKLVEAQNRVQFREAYRQVFGIDPEPADYDRITTEFISPNELIKQVQAQNSVDQMYEDVNDLVGRVYGEAITKEELLDMVLGRANTGDLQALIDHATKLDQYTALHKQYYGVDATPQDYAEYAGFTGPQELQWEIVTTEAISANRGTIQEAWAEAYPDEAMITDEELKTLYGEQEGYGSIQAKVKKANEVLAKKKQGEAYAMQGGEQAQIGYQGTRSGGFALGVPSLADV
jgi:peptidoglycan hydrolase-like protein with peptidoglycan-binding domain